METWGIPLLCVQDANRIKPDKAGDKVGEIKYEMPLESHLLDNFMDRVGRGQRGQNKT